MRTLRRQVAHNRMSRKGYRQVNKRKQGNPSFFSLHWREFV